MPGEVASSTTLAPPHNRESSTRHVRHQPPETRGCSPEQVPYQQQCRSRENCPLTQPQRGKLTQTRGFRIVAGPGILVTVVNNRKEVIQCLIVYRRGRRHP